MSQDGVQEALQQLIQLQSESLRLQQQLLERLAAPEPARPPLRVVDRYYHQPAAESRVSLDQLETLRAIQAAGDTARLVLAFGPHAGENLGQVAQSDPSYLRSLALSARRPDVRAAARHMLAALPTRGHSPRKPRP